jgi:apolipoprotein D and lipocalin family protein
MSKMTRLAIRKTSFFGYRYGKGLLAVGAFLLLSGCLGVPKGVSPVKNFELNRYLGKWYEIARLDHSFERGLTKVTAEYSLRADGGVKVVNQGFSLEDNEWVDAKGKAYFVQDEDEAYLKVSFFGPFYGSYVVYDLDQVDYQYSFVIGPDTSYLWFLSRTPTVSAELKEQFLQSAKDLDIDTSSIIWVDQSS